MEGDAVRRPHPKYVKPQLEHLTQFVKSTRGARSSCFGARRVAFVPEASKFEARIGRSVSK